MFMRPLKVNYTCNPFIQCLFLIHLMSSSKSFSQVFIEPKSDVTCTHTQHNFPMVTDHQSNVHLQVETC